MAERDGQLHEVLDGYAKFLQNKDLALDKHLPYLVRWVREFLLFARAHGGYSFEQTLDLFLAEVGGACPEPVDPDGVADWVDATMCKRFVTIDAASGNAYLFNGKSVVATVYRLGLKRQTDSSPKASNECLAMVFAPISRMPVQW